MSTTQQKPQTANSPVLLTAKNFPGNQFTVFQFLFLFETVPSPPANSQINNIYV
jgi:hypothetical protein